MNKSQKPILFYSEYCNHSKELIQSLYKTELYDKIIKVNIDENKYNLPPSIKMVPALLISNNNKPFVGNEVFSWCNDQLAILNKKNNEKKEIKAYFASEMAGYSDSYSYLQNDNTPMDHNFSFIGKNNDNINTPTSNDIISDNSKNKKSAISNDYERLIEQRKIEVRQAPQRT